MPYTGIDDHKKYYVVSAQDSTGARDYESRSDAYVPFAPSVATTMISR